jgi:hypothetical protein
MERLNHLNTGDVVQALRADADFRLANRHVHIIVCGSG